MGPLVLMGLMDILACVLVTSQENFAGTINKAHPCDFAGCLPKGNCITDVSILNTDVMHLYILIMAAELTYKESAVHKAVQIN